MALSPAYEAAVWEPITDNVYFAMAHRGHRIRCGIAGQALEILEPKLAATGRRRLDAFESHRSLVERLASTKFDDKNWERDGITILVRVDDLHRMTGVRAEGDDR